MPRGCNKTFSKVSPYGLSDVNRGMALPDPLHIMLRGDLNEKKMLITLEPDGIFTCRSNFTYEYLLLHCSDTGWLRSFSENAHNS